LEIPEPIPQRSDLAKAKRNVFFRHLAHEGIMLERMQRTLTNAEKLQRFASTGNTSDLPSPGDEEDMGVAIGNEIHYHLQGSGNREVPQPLPAPAPTPQPATTPPATKGSWLWPTVLGAALLGTGAGGGWLTNWYLNQQPPGQTGTDTDTDTDTITEIDFPQ
jgi:hypothetical protein